MSMQSTIDSIELQLSHRDAAIAHIDKTHTDETERLIALRDFYSAEIELRNRLRECTLSEIKWLSAQTAAMRQRRFEREITEESRAAGAKESMKQRLVAKLAKRNTGRAVE